MSSRPPPPPPLYPRETPPTQPEMAAVTQMTGPLPLPAPPFVAHSRRGSSRPPPPLHLAPLPLALDPAYQHHPPSLNAPGHESRWPAAPGDRFASGQPYTPPRSDPSYSPYYGQTLHEQTEFGGRPPLPMVEQRAWQSDSRRDFPTYPSPGYSDPRGLEGPYGPGSASGSVEGPPLSTPSYRGPEHVPTGDLDRYDICVRQQPLAARACGFGERDRRVIDPPPIVQLRFRDPSAPGMDPAELRYPFSVVHCTLWNEDGTADETAIPGQDRRMARRLMGTLVASPFVGVDEDDQQGCFFCFPDLSCRTHGRYRLCFVLMRIEMGDLRPGRYMPILTSVMTDVFTVFTAKDFPGMRASTALTKALKRQGCAIAVKKGNEKAQAHAREPESEEDEAAESQAMDKGKRQRKA